MFSFYLAIKPNNIPKNPNQPFICFLTIKSLNRLIFQETIKFEEED